MKKVLLTGGGTAGHVTPNLAILRLLRENSFEIHYAGTKSGIERELVNREGLPYHMVSAGKLRRYFDFKNFTDIFKIGVGFLQSLVLMIRLRPSVVFSKGGFVSCPVVWAAWLMRVPVVIHESDITPGLANRLSMPFAKKVCYSFPETGRYLRKKGVHTGLPVRQELYSGSAEEGRKISGFGSDKPAVLVIGGSQGSQMINAAVRSALDDLLEEFCVCHLCGKGALVEKGYPGYCQFEYVNDELSHLLAMADVVVARSGATTLFELLALRKPSLLIPLFTGASRGDQILNANSFEKQGFSRTLLQQKMTPETLSDNIRGLYKERYVLIAAMERSEFVNGDKRVAEEIVSVVKK